MQSQGKEDRLELSKPGLLSQLWYQTATRLGKAIRLLCDSVSSLGHGGQAK